MKHRQFRRRSLQRDLNRWILSTALIFVLIAGLTAGGIAFFEARELQDEMLREIAHLVNTGQITDRGRRHDLEEESILIRRLDVPTPQARPRLPENLSDGLQTITLYDERWRVLTISLRTDNRRYAIAQQTELRDEIALASSLNVFLPIAALVVVMLIIVHFIIRIRLRPLKLLADRLDQQDVTQIRPLPEVAIPEEITPFVASINALLARFQLVIQKQYRFIADAAHELRTPVAALSLLADNVAQAKSTVDRDERQQLLQQGLERLRGLVNQLLDLARLQSDHDGSFTSVSLNQVVQNAIADLYPLAEAGQVDLGMIRQEAVTVLDQDGQLSQLIHNAIDNAIRYTPADGKVDVSVYSEVQTAVFCVQDTGSGIADNELYHVMQPFYRAQHNTQPGNGLGLAICQEIAQRSGGLITLSNRQEGGLCFKYSQRLPK